MTYGEIKNKLFENGVYPNYARYESQVVLAVENIKTFNIDALLECLASAAVRANESEIFSIAFEYQTAIYEILKMEIKSRMA